MKKILLPIFMACIAWLLSACATNANLPATPTFVASPVVVHTAKPEFTCKVISAIPTTAPEAQSVVPVISDADFSIGPADAPVTILEYCDFQSQGCLVMAQTIAELTRDYEGRVRLVFRPLPLRNVLDKSEASALAAFAAGEQNKFWEMYDLLFVKYNEWVNLSPGQFQSWLTKEAVNVGIDVDQLTAAMKAEKAQNQLAAAYAAAEQ